MNTIEFYQNIVNLFICCLVSANLYYYYYVNESSLYFSFPFILMYFSIDLFFCTIDVKLHHVCACLVILSKYVYKTCLVDDYMVVLTFYKTEISSFFLIFRLFLKDYQRKLKKIF